MKLRFEADDVRRVVEHSLAAPEQRPIAYTKKPAPAPSVVLVHDDGVYLMSNGQPRDLVSGESSFCAYAHGCNPKTEPAEYYDNARALVGGDDFAETLPWAQEMKQLIDKGAKTITINFGKRSISLVGGSR